MSNVICFGNDINSYSVSRTIQSLQKNNIPFSYYNINNIVENNLEIIGLNNSKVLLVDNDFDMYKVDYELALSAVTNNEKTTAGKFYDRLKSHKFYFYNHLDNHFRLYNKWLTYNLLASNNLPVPVSFLIGRTSDILNSRFKESISLVKTPFFIRSSSAQDRNNNVKYSFVCNDKDDLALFHDEFVSVGNSNLLLMQQYIPHNFYITANVTYDKVRCFINSANEAISLPVHTKDSYIKIVTDIKNCLKLNCFSVSFTSFNGKNIILKVKVPGEIWLTDMLYNVNICDEIVNRFINE